MVNFHYLEQRHCVHADEDHQSVEESQQKTEALVEAKMHISGVQSWVVAEFTKFREETIHHG